jgi:hypothetical protein
MADPKVAHPSSDWDAMMLDLDLIHDLMGGTRQMRQAGLKWLPREQAESWEAWRLRLNRTVLFNGLSRTIQAMAGHALCGEVRLDRADEKIVEICRNIDGQGLSLSGLAMGMIQLLLRDGTAHLVVDQPEQGGRPYVVLVEAAEVIGRRKCGTRGQVDQVRIRQMVDQAKEDFTTVRIEQVRVFEDGGFSLWQQHDNKWVVAKSGSMGIDQIPVVTVEVGTPIRGVIKPPLMDLAWLNLAHWQSSSDQRHILHIARVPILFSRGMGHLDGPMDIGPNRLIIADDPSADIKFVEHSGAAIAAGRQDLIDLEEKMAVMGLDLMAIRPGHPTATGKIIDQAHYNATLQSVIDSLKDGLNEMLRLVALWLDIPESKVGEVVLPESSSVLAAAASDAEFLLKARQSGDLSRDEFLHEIERRGLFTPSSSGVKPSA